MGHNLALWESAPTPATGHQVVLPGSSMGRALEDPVGALGVLVEALVARGDQLVLAALGQDQEVQGDPTCPRVQVCQVMVCPTDLKAQVVQVQE